MRREAQGIPVRHTLSSVAASRRITPASSLRSRRAYLRRFAYGMGPRFASMCKLRKPRRPMASAGSRQGSLVTPGGAPMQPECMADEAMPAGAAPRSIN